MARVWDRTPDFTADAGPFTFGFDFESDVAVTVEGVWWWQTANGPTSVTAYLWDATGATQLATGVSGSLSLGWNLVAYESPFAADAGVTYAATVEIDAEHGYNTDGLPVTSPDGHVTITLGRFQSNHVGYPANTWSGLHGIDLEYEIAAQAAAGTLAGTLPSLTASLAGDVTAAGTLAGTLPALTADLDGTLAVSGTLTGTLPALAGSLRQGRATIARPDGGIVARPFTGIISRPFTGAIDRP